MATSQDKDWLVKAYEEQEKYGNELMYEDFIGEDPWILLEKYLSPIQRQRKTPIFPKNNEALEHILKKTENLRQNSKGSEKSEICLRLLFIIGKTEENQIWEEPIFNICSKTNDKGISLFIDSMSRVYDSWMDYLKNNELPKGEYVYPKSGKYECNEHSMIMLETGKSPASKKAAAVLNGLDKVSAVGSMAGLGVGLLTLTTLPVAAPVLAAALGTTLVGSGYMITRSSCKLADRKKHGQSIGLKDGTARSEWFNILSSTVIAGANTATIAVKTAATLGREIGAAGNVALKVSSRTAKTVRFVTGIGDMFNKPVMGTHDDLRLFLSNIMCICRNHNFLS